MKEMKEVHKLSFLMLKSYLIFTLMTSYYLRNDSCTKALQMCLYSSVRARGQSRTASQFLIKVEMKANALVQDWKDCIVEKAPVLTLTLVLSPEIQMKHPSSVKNSNHKTKNSSRTILDTTGATQNPPPQEILFIVLCLVNGAQEVRESNQSRVQCEGLTDVLFLWTDGATDDYHCHSNFVQGYSGLQLLVLGDQVVLVIELESFIDKACTLSSISKKLIFSEKQF